jgi:hypothetical protein
MPTGSRDESITCCCSAASDTTTYIRSETYIGVAILDEKDAKDRLADDMILLLLLLLLLHHTTKL